MPCALYALEVSEEAYIRARRRADHMMAHGKLYRFNVRRGFGAVTGCTSRWQRRVASFCSQFVGDVLEKSGALELPRTTPDAPNDYTQLGQLRCVYEGRLSGLPQRQKMDLGQDQTVISIYLGLEETAVPV